VKGCSVGSTSAKRSSKPSRSMPPPSDADGLPLGVPGGKAGLVKTEEFPARMLALAFDLLWTDHPLARDTTLARSGAEPRDQALLGRQLATLQLLPDHRPDAIEVHCPTSASLICAAPRHAKAVPTTPLVLPSPHDSGDDARVLLRGAGAVRDRLRGDAGSCPRRGVAARAARGHLRYRPAHLPGSPAPSGAARWRDRPTEVRPGRGGAEGQRLRRRRPRRRRAGRLLRGVPRLPHGSLVPLLPAQGAR